MVWTTCTLGDCLSLLSGGTPAKSNSSYWNGEIPWVSCKSIKDTRIYDTEDRVTQEAIGNGTRLVPKGTILFVVRGMILAKEFPVAEALVPVAFNQDLKAVVPNERIVDQRFLFYFLLAHRYGIRSLADEAAHGTKRIQTDRFLAYPFFYPSLPLQRRIASILSAYDDLIENNTRRIAILEEMARRLYDEWFVKFRFPGHEDVKFHDGLPDGWHKEQLEAVISFISRGIAPKYDEEAACRVVNQKCIRDQRLNMSLSRRQKKNVPENKVVRFGDVLINSTGVGTLGRVAQVYEQLEDVTVDSHVTIVRPEDGVDIDFFGLSLFSMQPYFEDQGVGSTGQTELSRIRVSETEIIIPPSDLQAEFGSKVRAMRRLCLTLSQKNENLRAQRDLLLPKLISGEIDVSQAESPGEEQ